MERAKFPAIMMLLVFFCCAARTCWKLWPRETGGCLSVAGMVQNPQGRGVK